MYNTYIGADLLLLNFWREKMALSNEYVTELYAALVAFDDTELLAGVVFNQDECAGAFYFESAKYWFNCSPAWNVFMDGEEMSADGVTEITIACGEGEVYLPYVLTGNVKDDVDNYFNILKGWIVEVAENL